ncbi:hypothetical protein H4582DRAFT_2072634 [Lactarius indigo]|nr:hypothetical protein H4582DRAFT_2072634 [Lactarius indigo]
MTVLATYIVCFYDWIISLDQEVALIHPASWNGVKAAYLFCRYYPMAIAPFHLWGLVGNHEQHVCESYYHALFACAMPTILSAQFILMLRTYAFSGRKKLVLVVLSITYSGLVGVIIWVLSKELSLAPLFFITNRNGCFAISDEPNFTLLVASVLQGSAVPVPLAYHIGMISILATVFDCLNMFIVLWYWVRGRGVLGPLGKSILTQGKSLFSQLVIDADCRYLFGSGHAGILVYVVMTALNALTISTFLSPYMVHKGLGSSSAFAYILPSAMSCRLVLMLRQKASPTETELRLEHSHMINEALELIASERHPAEVSRGSMPSISSDTEAQH